MVSFDIAMRQAFFVICIVGFLLHRNTDDDLCLFENSSNFLIDVIIIIYLCPEDGCMHIFLSTEQPL